MGVKWEKEELVGPGSKISKKKAHRVGWMELEAPSTCRMLEVQPHRGKDPGLEGKKAGK